MGKLTLALFVFGVFADDGYTATATNDLALDAHFFNRCSDFHDGLTFFYSSFFIFKALIMVFLKLFEKLFESIRNTPARQIIGRKLDFHFIARQNADEILPDFARDMRQDGHPVFQFHAKHGIGQRFVDSAFHFNNVFGHTRNR